MKHTIAIFAAAMLLMTGWQYRVNALLQAVPSAPSTPSSSVTIVGEDPIDIFIDTLDPNWYGGIYVQEHTYHILALPEYYQQLLTLAQQYHGETFALVVDDPGDHLIHSKPQLEAAAARLWANADELHVVGTGTFMQPDGDPRNGITVTISNTVPLTDELRKKVADCAQISSLRFENGDDENPNTGAI